MLLTQANLAAAAVRLQQLHAAWTQAVASHEWLKASYIANDLEAAARYITTATHYFYEEESARAAAQTEVRPDQGAGMAPEETKG